MVLLGNDLIIISSDSGMKSVVAASKSCTINVGSESIEVASPTTGDWKEFIAGRKSWSVSCSWLVPFRPYDVFEVMSDAFKNQGDGYALCNGVTTKASSYNEFVALAYDMNDNASLAGELHYDLEQPDDSLSQEFETFLRTYPNVYYAIAIFVSSDNPVNFGHDDEVWAMIKQEYGVSFTSPTGNQKMSLALISVPFGTNYKAWVKTSFTKEVVLQVPISNWDTFSQPTPEADIRQRLLSAGNIYNLSFVIEKGLINNVAVTGDALCTKAVITATKSNILQGSFEFQGTGPLAAPTST